MRKLMLVSFLILIALHYLSAKKVKFSVDMRYQVINATGVHVAGDFQAAAGFSGGDWQPNTTPLANEPGTDIYSIIVEIPAFTKYEYKFLNGDQWYDVEFVPVESRVGYNYNDNRWIWVDSLANDTTVIEPVIFAGNAPAGHFLLRLKVDMQNVAVIDPAGIHVAGDFQGWDPATAMMYSFEDEIYEYIAFVDSTINACEHRFVNGNTAGQYESVPAACALNGNRVIEIYSDTVTAIVCYAECDPCNSQGIKINDEDRPVHLFPNPTNDFTDIEFNDDAHTHDVIITDMSNRAVRTYKAFNGHSLHVDRSSLKSGVYIVHIVNQDKTDSLIKLIIQ